MTKRVILLLTVIALTPMPAALSAGAEGGGPTDNDEQRAEQSDEPTARPPGRRMARGLTDEQEQELLDVLREHQPAHYEQLAQLREADPRRYRLALMSAWRWYQRWKTMPEEVREASTAARNAQITIFRIMRELRGVEDPQAHSRLVRELRTAVREQFAAEQIVREYRLSELEAELERLREELQHRQENASELIEEQVDHHIEAATRPARRRRDRSETDE